MSHGPSTPGAAPSLLAELGFKDLCEGPFTLVSAAVKGALCMRLCKMDPRKDNSLVHTNKPWLLIVSRWRKKSSIHSRDGRRRMNHDHDMGSFHGTAAEQVDQATSATPEAKARSLGWERSRGGEGGVRNSVSVWRGGLSSLPHRDNGHIYKWRSPGVPTPPPPLPFAPRQTYMEHKGGSLELRVCWVSEVSVQGRKGLFQTSSV